MFDFGKLGESAINNGINSLFSFLGAKAQNKWNRENMAISQGYTQDNMQLSNDIWKEQNAIQMQNQMDLTRMNPILQKQGMMQAGMNPNGQMSGNVAAAPTGTSAPSASGASPLSASNPFTGAFDLFGKMKELEIMESQKNLLDTQANNVAADTEGKNIDNSWKDPLSQAQKESLEATRDARYKEIEKYGKDMELTDAQMENLKKQTSWIDTLNQAELDKVKAITDEALKEVEKIDQEILESQSRVDLNKSLSAEARARANKELEETKGVRIANQIKEIELKCRQAGVSPDATDAITTSIRNVLLNPDAYGGREKASALIRQLLDQANGNDYIQKRYGTPTATVATVTHNVGGQIKDFGKWLYDSAKKSLYYPSAPQY